MSLLSKLHRIISRHAKDVVWVEGVWVEGVDEPVVFVGPEIFRFFACDSFYVFIGEAVSVEVGSQQDVGDFPAVRFVKAIGAESSGAERMQLLIIKIMIGHIDHFTAHEAFHVRAASFKGYDFAHGVFCADDVPFAFVLAIFIYCEQRVFRVDLSIFVVRALKYSELVSLAHVDVVVWVSGSFIVF